ncbi:MAG TPA: hypothetical protein VND90_06300 [Terracidiphilus sp.]|nr:hypothetical protein [Terracidiphilus sp.]
MRWLMIGLIVSLGTLLFVAAGVARHIWLHRRGRRDNVPTGALEPGDDADLESEL